MKRIRVGVVGVGYIGQFHAEKYAQMEGVELVGVVDTNIKRAREVAERNHTQFFYHHSELFKRIDAVSIAVPTPLHYSITKDFFLNGVDVLLEKPMTKTVEEAEDLISLSEKNGLIFQIGHLERFNSALVSLEGNINKPLFIQSLRLSPFSGREVDINVVLDLMIHDIDIILTIVKSEIVELRGWGISILTSHYDIANGQIQFQNGCIADLTVSRVFSEKVRKTWFFEKDRTLVIDYLSQKASRIKKDENLNQIVVEELSIRKRDLLEAELSSFIESVRSRGNVKVSGYEGKRALEVALKLIEKMDEKRVVN